MIVLFFMNNIKVSNKPHIAKVEWKDVRKVVEAVNAPLAKIIDALDPGPKYTLYKATYPFGCESVREGHLYLPSADGEMLPLDDPRLPEEFRRELGYNVGTNPVSLVLKNQFEIYLELEDRSILMPIGPISPGAIFSTGRLLSPLTLMQPAFLWNVSAGVRSLFMLPKISSASGYKRLKRALKISIDEPPKTILEHQEVFKAIANNSNFGETWAGEILYFGKKWFDHLEDKSWVYFNQHLYKAGWHAGDYWRYQFVWELIYSIIKRKRKLRPNPYIDDIVKHLLAIGVGAVPGFSPAITDDGGPIKRLQKIFKEIYCIEDYAPIIMQPKFLFTNVPNDAVYYSISYPTTIAFSPSTRKDLNKITHLSEIKYLMDKYFEEIAKPYLNLSNTPISMIPVECKYAYFHNEYKNYNGIRPTEDILAEDKLLSTICTKDNCLFPANSPFINGCIRISRVNHVR